MPFDDDGFPLLEAGSPLLLPPLLLLDEELSPLLFPQATTRRTTERKVSGARTIKTFPVNSRDVNPGVR